MSFFNTQFVYNIVNFNYITLVVCTGLQYEELIYKTGTAFWTNVNP